MTGSERDADERREELEKAAREHAVEPGRVREDAPPEIREGEREE